MHLEHGHSQLLDAPTARTRLGMRAITFSFAGLLVLGRILDRVDADTVAEFERVAGGVVVAEHRLINEMPMLYHCIVHAEPTDEEDSS